MQVDVARYDHAVHSIYAAALEPRGWPAAVAAVAEACQARHALLFTWAHAPADGGFTFSHNIAQSTLELWAAKSMHEDPFVREAARRGVLTQGTVMLGDDLVAPVDVVGTPFFLELWQPIDFAGVCSSVVFDASDPGNLPTILAIYHSSNDPRFTHDHVGLLRRLMLHMSRALGVMFRLRDASLQIASSRATLDRLACGVVLLDNKGSVRFMNQTARSATERGTTIQIVAEVDRQTLHLVPAQQRHESALRKAVRAALDPLNDQQISHFSEAVVLTDADDRPRTVIHIAPIGVGHGFGDTQTAGGAIVLFHDLHGAAPALPTALASHFKLTPAEIRAALQALQGGSSDEMAARLGVSLHTFKSQLKSIYSKTRTNRQADLVKLLLALSSN